MKATITPWLDTRKAKKDSNIFPVKLEIVFKQNVYRIGIGEDCTIDEALTFGLRISKTLRSEARLVTRLTNKQRSMHKRIKDARDEAERICDEMGAAFDYKTFIDEFEGKAVDETSFYDYWQKLINNLIADGKVGTANSYQSAYNKFKEFYPELDFSDFSPAFFTDFAREVDKQARGGGKTNEKFKRKVKREYDRDKVQVSIGFYVRSIRVVINRAMADNLMKPVKLFGKKAGLFRIPGKGKRVKKWATKEDLDRLFSYPSVGRTKFYIDMFRFMFNASGIYPSDLIHLEWKHIKEIRGKGRYLVFKRKKTENTDGEKWITVKIKPIMEEIIEMHRYRSESGETRTTGFIFPILDTSMSAVEMRNKQRDLTAGINKVLRRVTSELGIEHLSSKSARHSFAQASKRNNLPTGVISDALGHNSSATTESYLSEMDFETADLVASVTD